MRVVYRADLHTVFEPKADIVGKVFGPRLCVYVGACKLAYVLYTVLTCIPYSALRGTLWVRSSALVCVCVCVCMCVCVCVCVCDQLSAQVVFMKLSKNLFLCCTRF